MNMDAQFTDEQLTAYLDGEAADELCTMIDAALDVDEVLGERLADLDIGLDQISAAFDGLLAQAPAMA